MGSDHFSPTGARSPTPSRPCRICGLTESCWSARRRRRQSTKSTHSADHIPTVVAGTREPRLTAVDLVANDDYRGGRLATRAPARSWATADSPHRRRGRGRSPARAGYEASMAEAGLEPRASPGTGPSTTGHRVAGPSSWIAGATDGDLRRERPLRGRCVGRRGRPRPAGPGGPSRSWVTTTRWFARAEPTVVDHHRQPHRRGRAGCRPRADRPDRRARGTAGDPPVVPTLIVRSSTGPAPVR